MCIRTLYTAPRADLAVLHNHTNKPPLLATIRHSRTCAHRPIQSDLFVSLLFLCPPAPNKPTAADGMWLVGLAGNR